MAELGGNPLLGIALIFLAGYPVGLLARRIGIPAVTGNILAGIILGPSVLGFFDHHLARDLENVTIFAMGFITAVIGGHLNYRRIHNAKRRIISTMVGEVALTGTLVALAIYASGQSWEIALILGAIATATAPATVLAVVKEEKAKGLLVKTLLSSVALDNVFCILLFSLATALVAGGVVIDGTSASFMPALVKAFASLVGSVMFGSLLGWILLTLIRRETLEPFSGLFIAILFASGGAQNLGLSPLMACLALGLVLGNSGRATEDVLYSLESVEPILLTCFFTLAGIDLRIDLLPALGLAGAAYFFARAAGKVCGGYMGALVGSSPPRVREGVGPALVPQAGLAIGLVVLMQGDPRFSQEMIATITNIVLGVVVINEIIGPTFVRRSLRRAGESGKDRRRIVEFLQEEFVMVPLRADDKWDAIRQLCGFLIRTHGIADVTEDELVQTVEEREYTFSTAIGMGVALPHARLPAGPEIMGVMGICPDGIDFDAMDGQPVRLVVLIATPEDHVELHLDVMAAIARIVSHGEIRARLFGARTPAQAIEIIENDMKQDYNYFLED